MKLPSPSQRQFATVPSATIPRSKIARKCGNKLTFDADYLVPVFVDEILPGDTFNLKATFFARLNTPLVPIMDNLYLDTFWFFVPYRLVWSNWVYFCGELQDPGDLGTSYTIPQATTPANGYGIGTLEDYFGIPTDVVPTTTAWTISCLPRRAYYRIWNEWFRDENLQDSYTHGLTVGNGPDGAITSSGSTLKKRGKRHDYFTSCLPWPQKGTAVSLPLGTSAPVFVGSGSTAIGVGVTQAASSTPKLLNDAGASNIQATGSTGGTAMLADLSNATAATINELRQAFQVQRLMERDARGGTRYVELIKSHFGVTSPDFRLQRPEYLGGDSVRINISPIAQTSATASEPTELGSLAAMGTAVSSRGGFVKSFTEHGVVIGLASVRADLTYQEGLNRMWSRSTKYDFFWPSLQHIGEQAVLNKEIYLQDHADDESTFGYQERYAEYRYKPSQICGKLRSSASGTLEIWHLAQEFGSLPTLDDTFIQSYTDLDRCIATPAEPHITMDCYYDLVCARPMALRSVPGLIDHF